MAICSRMSAVRILVPLVLSLLPGPTFAADFEEFHLGPSPTPTSQDAKPKKSSSRPAKTVTVQATPTPVPDGKKDPVPTATPTLVLSQAGPSPTPGPPSAQPTASPVVVTGTVKMKDIYEAGIQSYRAKDYEKAIRYLKQAIAHQDPYTPKYYYAEANAMLGVIYQYWFRVGEHKDLACGYYQAALAIDPATKTAKAHLKEVCGGKAR
jgi:tetratricopeptide (TPR) repeat protein